MKQTIHRHKQQGLTLVEIMVAMVLGMVVIGVVLSNYLTSSIGKNSSTALQQMSEDATVALNVIRKHVSTAGYSNPVGSDATGLLRNPIGPRMFGCETGFANPALPFATLSCAAAGSGSDAIAVAYEADRSNSVWTTTAPAEPRDCIGNGITLTAAATGNYYVSSPRIYTSNNQLMCHGNSAGAQPLVPNIRSLWIRYGVAAPLPTDPSKKEVYTATPVKYAKASEVSTAAEWPRVVAVRVCIEVQSADEVLDAPTPYYSCRAIEAPAADFDATTKTPALITPADRRMYRAFSTTIMLQNHR